MDHDIVQLKEEPAWENSSGVSDAVLRTDLYVNHEFKDELAVGPELVQQQDIAYFVRGNYIFNPFILIFCLIFIVNVFYETYKDYKIQSYYLALYLY